MSPELAELAELADAYGVATTFSDWRGVRRDVAPATLRAVLAALGVDAAAPAEVGAALRARATEPWRRLLPATVVARAGQPRELTVATARPDLLQVHVELEDGGARQVLAAGAGPGRGGGTRTVDGRERTAVPTRLPADLPPGYHALHARAGDEQAQAVLVVPPARLDPPAALGERRAWGLMAQLYQVRSARSWGIGDLGDLATLATWSGAALGAGFVLVNPLHAAEPVPPMEPSPYLPTTRRFANPVYLRVEDVPEYAGLPAAAWADAAARAAPLQAAAGNRHQLDRLDRDAAWAAKRAVLQRVHALPRSEQRAAAYADFRRREGPGLVDFATWCTLAEVHGLPWRSWPAQLHDPHSAAVERARAEHAELVDFHCWLQWQLDDQLAGAQRAARAAGMPLGVVHDLAVGVHPDGADTWALGDALARGVTTGAPPDEFNQQGQDWSQPPWRPDRLAELGYAPYRDLLRTVLRHAGGIRVDHVMGLWRLWWVPQGAGPVEGTYVRYDPGALVGILALEAARAGAIVIGEDLGTVEPGVRETLRERGVLGTSIVWFERDHTGGPLPPDRWRELCLATVGTHDLPPTAGYLTGEHLRVRAELGLLTRPLAEERADGAAGLRAQLELLRSLRLLPPEPADRLATSPAGPDGWPELADEAALQAVVEALHRELALTPARLLGVLLPDLVGDRRAINQPGTAEEYPNWRLPLADPAGRPVRLEDLMASPRARALARAVGAPCR